MVHPKGEQPEVRGATPEDRDLLAAFYGWFAGRFGTADLKEAKALLDGLA